MGEHSDQTPTGFDALGRFPARLETTSDLAEVLAALPQDTPLRLQGTTRVAPEATAGGTGAIVPVASVTPHPSAPGLELNLSAQILGDAGQPPPPESTYALNPLDRAHEASLDAYPGETTAAAAETLRRLAGYLSDGHFSGQVTEIAGQLRDLAAQLVDETTLIELEQEL